MSNVAPLTSTPISSSSYSAPLPHRRPPLTKLPNRPTARPPHRWTTTPRAGRLNIYVVLGLGQRRMRTQISLDNNSPQFNESFWVLLDREYDASQLLSMQVYHHSLHPSESDVRLGIAFMSLVSMKMSDSKDWKVVLGGAAACSRAPLAAKQPLWPQSTAHLLGAAAWISRGSRRLDPTRG